MDRSLLVVDDDICQLAILNRWFRRRGYNVVTAAHPRLALVAARGRQFRVAIIDASLPEIDGIELMRRLKRSQNELQAIILSGYAFADHESPEHWARADRAFACVVKPCQLAMLQAIVEKAFDHEAEEWTYQEKFVSPERTLYEATGTT